MFSYIDLFAGAGGLSEGFIQEGFLPIAHVESDADASRTLETRTAYHYLKGKKSDLYKDYLTNRISREELLETIPSEKLSCVHNTEISRYSIEDLVSQLRKDLRKTGKSEVDAIVGGPPCQPFSLMGRGVLANRKNPETRRNLYRYFVRFLKEFKPKVFVFENVPGLLSSRHSKTLSQLVSAIEDQGYHLEYQTLNANDFGVLQQRRRVIIIGWKRKLQLEYPKFNRISGEWSVRDLFSDLPSLTPGEDGSAKGYFKPANNYLVRMKLRGEHSVLTQHLTRTHNDRDREIYRLVIKAWEEKSLRLKYNELPQALRDRPNLHAFLDRYKVVAPDLPYSHTLLAHISKDGHYYIFPDKDQARSLSVREAARIQSFPDNYFFEGSRTSAFKQIGNAVPPLMSRKIASQMKGMLL